VIARLACAAAAGLVAIGVGAEAQSAGEQPSPTAVCGDAAQPARRGEVPRPKLRLAPDRRATIVLRTHCGAIAIRLAVRRAPETTSSVAGLVKRGYYDRLTFHRVALGFVIQGGDPRGDGRGGPGYRVVERPPRGLRYTRGIIGMARAVDEPDGASGSQFFIVTARDAALPPTYALLGRVTAGMDAVDRIEALGPRGRLNDGPPRRPVVIRRALLRIGPGGG
jgi:peptidyl-prolyl cis-trans isomerase B (cyclophilin B)